MKYHNTKSKIIKLPKDQQSLDKPSNYLCLNISKGDCECGQEYLGDWYCLEARKSFLQDYLDYSKGKTKDDE
jgi:hypothetical protein